MTLRDFWRLFFIEEKIVPKEIKYFYKGFILKLQGKEVLVKLLAHLRGKKDCHGEIENLQEGL